MTNRTMPIALILASIGVQPAAADTTRLLVNCIYPPQHFVCKDVLPAWGDAVEEATERRVRVSFPASNLAPGPEQMASIRSGIFDVGTQFTGFITNEVVGAQVAMLPFVSSSGGEANSVALWRTYERFLAGTDEYEGVTLLSLMAIPGSAFFSTTDEPITSLATATDRKMWAPPGATSDILKEAGAGVVSGPAIQMTEIVQRGVVDGFVGISIAAARGFGVLSYATSITRTDPAIFTGSFSLLVNDAKWAEISADDQAAIMAVSGESFASLWGKGWDAEEKAARDGIPDETEIIEASDGFTAELSALAKPYIDDWIASAAAKGFDGQAALDFYREQIVELSDR